jgi:Cu/Ag efflux protein CusF
VKHVPLFASLMLAGVTPSLALAAGEPVRQGSPVAQAGDVHKLHGIVNSVNASASRLNITHDPVESLKWPKMKMNFKVQDPAMLADLTAGTVVDFEIQKIGDEFVVTRITPVK